MDIDEISPVDIDIIHILWTVIPYTTIPYQLPAVEIYRVVPGPDGPAGDLPSRARNGPKENTGFDQSNLGVL